MIALARVDIVCIDQSNIEEPGQQVEFMAEIYKEAGNVLVWLGEETSGVFQKLLLSISSRKTRKTPVCGLRERLVA